MCIYNILQKLKVIKKSQKSRNQEFLLYFFCTMMEGSGFVADPGSPKTRKLLVMFYIPSDIGTIQKVPYLTVPVFRYLTSFRLPFKAMF